METIEAVYERVRPFLEARETRRRAAVRRAVIAGGVGAAGGLAAGALIAAFLSDLTVALMAGIALFALASWWGFGPLRRLKREVKHELNTELASAFSLDYAPQPAFPARFDAFRDHGLVPRHDRKSFEDHFAGERHGAKFELYEAHLEERRRSKNRTYYVTVFRGALLRIAFPRTIEGVTLVTRDKGLFNAFEGFFKRSFADGDLKRVGLVDPNFEAAFEVYASDQVMSRYLLTPSFMQRLLDLETTLKGQKIRCVFDEKLSERAGEGELLIALETRDRFEPGSMFTPLASIDRIRQIHAEMSEIEKITDAVLAPARREEESALA